ncbi:MAG: calcineurin-like phosphoesterase family protein [Sphingobacterium sp.]|jgi:hypothetical protein|nr:calcineurin-like phosphoesterase family protein [Sphingobacterium sp.]
MRSFNSIAILSVCLTFGTISCKDKNITQIEEQIATVIKITHIDIPYVYNIANKDDIKIIGRGFMVDDIIAFIPKSGQDGGTVELPINSLAEDHILLSPAEKLGDGNYEIRIKRGSLNQLLGKTYLNPVFNTDLPDKENMTVKGTVYSNGQGIANVIVSDGFEFTTTDQNGVYYLPSAKKNGNVFITVPANYEVAVANGVPQFFKKLVGIQYASEIKDFELIQTNNDNHVVAFMADIHLANRNGDLGQFQSGFIKDLNETYAFYKQQGKKFYGLTLGDQSWDAYWYSNNFKLAEYLNQVKDLEFPIYNVIGNHDFDPYVALNDLLAAAPYRNLMGPTYYSINIGKVHYVILNNMVYKNDGGSIGTIGSREYDNILVQEQLDWLQKDLSYITDKSTPIVVAMHVPLYTNPNASGNYGNYMQNSPALVNALSNFDNVKVLTGHSHINYRITPKGSNVSEHNMGAVSATWWWTGSPNYAGNHICKDGSPGGYGVWEMEGKNQKWYYKGIGYEKDYQFRAYDLNKVHITADTHSPKANAEFKAKVPDIAGEYATASNKNQVLINIWGYQDNWQISIKENGQTLPYSRVFKKDPLHLISYDLQRINVNADPTSSFTTIYTGHLFLTTASNATSTLEITVTDEFGRKYTETMTRPKAFSYSMR